VKDPRTIVKRAMISEKGSLMLEKANTYVFEVAPGSNKLEIKKAVELIFNVNVLSVRTMNMYGKSKRLGVHLGRRAHWKKAIVKLKEGQTIELFEQV
jgi:large subunit ribosomal protein L23